MANESHTSEHKKTVFLLFASKSSLTSACLQHATAHIWDKWRGDRSVTTNTWIEPASEFIYSTMPTPGDNPPGWRGGGGRGGGGGGGNLGWLTIKSVPQHGVFVSSRFEPSQPLGIISGLEQAACLVWHERLQYWTNHSDKHNPLSPLNTCSPPYPWLTGLGRWRLTADRQLVLRQAGAASWSSGSTAPVPSAGSASASPHAAFCNTQCIMLHTTLNITLLLNYIFTEHSAPHYTRHYASHCYHILTEHSALHYTLHTTLHHIFTEHST